MFSVTMFTASTASSTCSGYPARNGSSICRKSAPAAAPGGASGLGGRRGGGQRGGFGVGSAGQRADQVAGPFVGAVADPAGQRERAGEGELDRMAGEVAGGLGVTGQFLGR